MKKLFSFFILALFTTSVQAQLFKTVNVSTAGSLTTLLTSSEKTTITNLILTGIVDARDIKCLRDEMTVLTALDLSGVSINAYNGNGGTVTSSTFYPANEMPQYSFYNITIPASKTTLSTIFLPNSLTSIGKSAFYSCSGLTGIIIPNSVTTIRNYSFQYCYGLYSITIGSGVTSIGDQAFYHCTGLKIVTTLNPSPPTLGGLSFGWNYISIVYVPDASLNAYKAATGNSNPSWSQLPVATNTLITIYNPVAGQLKNSLSNKGITLSNISKLIVTGTIDSVDINLMNAKMPLLMELDISGTTITGNSLPVKAFYGKTILKTVKLPASVVSIGDNAFSNCTNLVGLNVLPTALKSIGNSSFLSCTSLSGNLTIPADVSSIGNYAFNGCTGLNGTLTLPQAITTIPIGAFQGCTGISGILNIPQSVTSIGSSAFYGCSKLTGLNITKYTTTIANYAFQNCSGLTKISVPNTLPPHIYANTFFGVNKGNCTLEITTGSKAAYQADTNWKLFTLFSETPGTYGIKLQIGENGNVQLNEMNLKNDTVLVTDKNTVQTFSLVPNKFYKVDSLMYNGADVTSQIINNQYTTPIVNNNDTLKATFLRTYKIAVQISPALGGNVIADSTILSKDTVLTVSKNDSITFTIKPNVGYVLDSVTYAGVTVKIVKNQFTILAFNADDTLRVIFKKTYNITLQIENMIGGSVIENNINRTNNIVFTINKNDSITFIITPNEGYELESLTFGDKAVKVNTNHQFNTGPVISDDTLIIVFQKIYDIIVQIGQGGSLKVNNATLNNDTVLTVFKNNTRTFEIFPKLGYEVDSLILNSGDVTSQVSNNQYTTPYIMSNDTLRVTFRKIQYNISLQDTIAGSINLMCEYGDTLVFSFTSSPGWEVNEIKFLGKNVTDLLVNGVYTIPAVNNDGIMNISYTKTTGAPKLINSKLKIDSYPLNLISNGKTKGILLSPKVGVKASTTDSISVQIGAGGSIEEFNTRLTKDTILSRDTILTINEGDTIKFTFLPDTGYQVATLTYNGQDIKSQISNNQFTLLADNIKDTLIVTFEKIKYSLSIKDSSMGAVNLICEYGDTPSFEFTPSTNYKINTITYNGNDVTSLLVDNVFTVPAVTGDGLLNVSFVDITTGAPQLIKSNVKVFTSQSDIIIDGTSEGEMISLYTVNGTQIKTLKSRGERMIIPAQRDAIYLIRTESKTFKVIL